MNRRMDLRYAKWLCGCLCLIAVGICGASASTIRIDAGKPGARFDPNMYGLFLEEVNHSCDGGLYAEMVRNRGFEDSRLPEGTTLNGGGFAATPAGFSMRPDTTDKLPGWSLVTRGAGRGAIYLDTANPLNKATPSSLRLEVENPEGGVGIANQGFWGMNVRAGELYDLSLYARCEEGFEGSLSVCLEGKDGKPVSSSMTISGLSADWKQFKCTLSATASDSKARLVILADAKGSLWFDMVSLFPRKTYKNRPNGLRPDLVQMMADMKPKFIRWPGGCTMEGISIDNMFRWKDTVGDIATRPGRWNLWGRYRRTEGLGYHEFLQLCQDIGCEPLLACNVGMTCVWNWQMLVPVSDLQPYIDDALDAIEYANGPVTSKWGALRTASGHPAPFNLKYIELGNENWGQAYDERYSKFFSAIKAKYPDIRTIATSKTSTAPTEMLDVHFYNTPEYYSANFGFFDDYKRKDPPVYVGEYWARDRAKRDSLYRSLAESVLLLGCERNADVVRMVSAAPLLMNKDDATYNPCPIMFDNQTAFGGTSYYVFKMLAENLPDRVLPVETEISPGGVRFLGGIGVGTWQTKAEFKDIKVTKGGKVLYSSDFSNGSIGWQPRGEGTWDVVDGAYRQSSTKTDCNSMFGDKDWSDYTISLKARKIDGLEGFLISFNTSDLTTEARWNIGGWGNAKSAVQNCDVIVGNAVPCKIETGRWYDIRIALSGRNIKCFLDGTLIHDLERPVRNLAVCAGRQDSTGDIIVKVINPTMNPCAVDLSIKGTRRIAGDGLETVLTSSDSNDGNSFANPRKVVPVTRKVSGFGSSFRYTFGPYALYILRLKTR